MQYYLHHHISGHKNEHRTWIFQWRWSVSWEMVGYPSLAPHSSRLIYSTHAALARCSSLYSYMSLILYMSHLFLYMLYMLTILICIFSYFIAYKLLILDLHTSLTKNGNLEIFLIHNWAIFLLTFNSRFFYASFGLAAYSFLLRVIFFTCILTFFCPFLCFLPFLAFPPKQTPSVSLAYNIHGQ